MIKISWCLELCSVLTVWGSLHFINRYLLLDISWYLNVLCCYISDLTGKIADQCTHQWEQAGDLWEWSRENMFSITSAYRNGSKNRTQPFICITASKLATQHCARYNNIYGHLFCWCSNFWVSSLHFPLWIALKLILLVCQIKYLECS